MFSTPLNLRLFRTACFDQIREFWFVFSASYLIHPQMVQKMKAFHTIVCVKDSAEHKPLMSHGLKATSAKLEDQTLHLTVRLQAEEDEEEQEEEQDDEIGGLINSDGEVVEWDASK